MPVPGHRPQHLAELRRSKAPSGVPGGRRLCQDAHGSLLGGTIAHQRKERPGTDLQPSEQLRVEGETGGGAGRRDA